MTKITEKDLKKYIALVAVNFRFKLEDGFDLIFKIIFEKVKDMQASEIQKKFEQLLLTTSEDWNEKYRGFGGYPNLSQWIEILTGERPLTDFEKSEANKKHNENLLVWVGTIIVWINDQNLETLFKSKYLDYQNQHITKLVDGYYPKKPSNDEEIIKLARWLKKEYEADKIAFKAKLKAIAEKQNPLPFSVEFKPDKQMIALPILKNINNLNK